MFLVSADTLPELCNQRAGGVHELSTLRAALDTLDDAGLVHLPGAAGTRGRHEGFTLLDEAGWQIAGDPLPDAVPAKREDYFTLPAGFVINGSFHAEAVDLVIADAAVGILALTVLERSTRLAS